MPRDGIKNLKPTSTLTMEERRELGRLGGIASGKARAKRKTLKQELELLLSIGTIQEDICKAMLKQAKKGDTKAFTVVRDTIGETTPVTDVEAVTVVDDL